VRIVDIIHFLRQIFFPNRHSLNRHSLNRQCSNQTPEEEEENNKKPIFVWLRVVTKKLRSKESIGTAVSILIHLVLFLLLSWFILPKVDTWHGIDLLVGWNPPNVKTNDISIVAGEEEPTKEKKEDLKEQIRTPNPIRNRTRLPIKPSRNLTIFPIKQTTNNLRQLIYRHRFREAELLNGEKVILSAAAVTKDELHKAAVNLLELATVVLVVKMRLKRHCNGLLLISEKMAVGISGLKKLAGNVPMAENMAAGLPQLLWLCSHSWAQVIHIKRIVLTKNWLTMDFFFLSNEVLKNNEVLR
jgi:hypothetical protein